MSFPKLRNDRLLKAATGQTVDKIPVWVMRQAGRFLPEFRKFREKYDFFTICQTPELAAEVTLMPINRFELDAAIIFSDILVIPQALGLEVQMKPGVGPVLPDPLVTPSDISRLKYPVDVKATLGYVFEAITLTRRKLDGKVPLIGFSGAPWTLISYMIEGGGSKTMSKSKLWLYKYKADSERLFDIVTKVVIDYLAEQIKAGAQMIQIFESHAEYLNEELSKKWIIPYLVKIASSLKQLMNDKTIDSVPISAFVKGGQYYALEELSKVFDVISIDWTLNPKDARKYVNVTLQGNLDPCALYASDDDIRKYTTDMISNFGKTRYIANLGHGIYPDVEPEKLGVFIDAVHKF